MTYKFSFKAKNDNIGPAIKKALHWLKQAGIKDAELQFKIELCTRELIANAIEHGSNKAEDKINLELIKAEKQFSLSVEDMGPGFNWPEKEITIMPELAEKGRGLPIVFSLADKLEFNQTGNKATIYMTL